MKSTASIYRAFRIGAGLFDEDVQALLVSRGIHLSRNRIHEFGRNSDRGGVMTNDELYHLVSAWADREVQRRENTS